MKEPLNIKASLAPRHKKRTSEEVRILRAPPGTRTPDTLIKSQVLYQLS